MATRTTTIRLAPALRRRVDVAARRVGQSSHAFILEAIARTLDETEEEAAFDQLADERWEEFLRTGKAVAWKDARPYLEALGREKKAKRPRTRQVLR